MAQEKFIKVMQEMQESEAIYFAFEITSSTNRSVLVRDPEHFENVLRLCEL